MQCARASHPGRSAHHGGILCPHRLVQRSIPIGVAHIDIPAGLDAPGHHLGIRYSSERPGAPVFAVRGISHPPLVVARRGIGPKFKQLTHHGGVFVRQGCMQGRVAGSVPSIRIGSRRNQCSDDVRLPTRGRNLVQRGPAVRAPCVRVRAGFQAARHLVDGGVPEEVPRAPTRAVLLAGGGRRAEEEDGCGRNERPACNVCFTPSKSKFTHSASSCSDSFSFVSINLLTSSIPCSHRFSTA